MLLASHLVTASVFAQAPATVSSAAQEAAAVRGAVERIAESVVQIRTIGGLDEVDRTMLADGPTTGLILSSDGWIVSSSFNFIQQPATILVMLPGGGQLPAELIARDHSRMLALLKVNGVDDLPVPALAPADEVRVGQWAIAVGRTFRADRPNVSVGIVSALNRMFGKVLQTDADVSTANYGGPLIDIRGRVLGVVVPIAPQMTSEVAGSEWYDSGIGFAAPLAEIADALERMKQGEDQHAGVIGIGLKGSSPHESPAEIAVVLPNAPAGKAGFRKGDRIVDIAGQPIRTQTDLRFALGKRYAGEEIQVTVKRDDEELTRRLTLAGELEPFRHAFLGILPLREARDDADDDAADDATDANDPADDNQANSTDEKPDSAQDAPGKDSEPDPQDESDADSGATDDAQGDGVLVRSVFVGSPAAAAGIQPADRVLRIDDSDVDTIGDALDAMNAVWPESEVSVTIERQGERLELTLRASRLPTNIPAALPAAYDVSNGATANEAEDSTFDVRELKLAEFPQTCRVYVPPSHESGRDAGMLLWLHAPGASPSDDFLRLWQPICDRDGLLLVVPSAADPVRWERTELEYLRRLSERVLRQYRVDPRRVVVSGREGGGAMAYFLALSSRGLFTGVATWSSTLPRTIRVQANRATSRLAIFAGLPPDSRRHALVRFGLKKLSDAGYPVTMRSQSDPRGKLTDDDRQQLVRWIDTLDRF